MDKSVEDVGISDHYVVISTLDIAKPRRSRKAISFKKIKDINTAKLSDDISKKYDENNLNKSDVNDATSIFNSQLSDLLDQHAPLQTKRIVIRPNTQWYSQLIREQKTIRRRLERKYVKSGLDCDKSKYRDQYKYVNFLMDQGKSELFQIANSRI